MFLGRSITSKIIVFSSTTCSRRLERMGGEGPVYLEGNKIRSFRRLMSFGAQDWSRLPKTATVLTDEPKVKVVLLGTVHFSKASVEDVTTIVNILKPNTIMVELCRQRVGLLELDDEKFLKDAQNFDSKKAREAVKGQDFFSGMMHAILLKSYADISKELGVAPGAEFRRAYQEMKKIPGCKLYLGDRPIQITIARAFQSLTVLELAQVLFHISKSKPMPVNESNLEKYKDKKFVNSQFEEITKDFPAFQKIFNVFVDERDVCLAFSLQECVLAAEPAARVLAVVGMGHVDGVRAHFGRVRRDDVLPLLSVPQPPLINRALVFSVKWTFYFLMFSFFYRLIFK